MQLAEAFDLLHRQRITGQVQQRIQQHGTMAVGQHKAVTICPFGIGRVVPQVVIPQHLGDFGHAHGHARMAGVGFLYCIHRQRANGVGKIDPGCHVFLWRYRKNRPGARDETRR